MAEQLLPLFEASISPDAGVRLQAEDRLRSLHSHPGVLSSTLTLIASPAQPPSAPQAGAGDAARLSAAVYLKNAVFNHWKTDDALPAPDKSFIRTNLLHAIVSLSSPGSPPSSRSTRGILVAVLGIIVPLEFPQGRWNELIGQVAGLLRDQRYAGVEAGLLTMIEVMRMYRWHRSSSSESESDSRKSKEVDVATNITNHIFPSLLTLAQSALSSSLSLQPLPSTPEESDLRQGKILYLVFKIYKTSITTELSAYHQTEVVGWGGVMLGVVKKRMREVRGVPEDEEDRAKYPWWKAKKWAYYSLNRLFSRYGQPANLTKTTERYRPFAGRFVVHFAPEILKTYLGEVELYVRREEWVSDKVLCLILVFLEESVKPKETWNLLKPHLDPLISSFLFPLLCISPSELSSFADDPTEFVKSHFGEFVEDLFAMPATAAASLVVGLASGRKKATFVRMLGFVNDVCAKYPAERSAVEKDGALRMLAHLSSIITETKSLQGDMETFFRTFVFPEFESEHGFLRCRACEVVHKFETFNEDWQDPQALETVFQGIMRCLVDPSLPVRVQAALALPDLVEYEQVRSQLAPNIGRVIQELLSLSNEVDLDNLTMATRVLVSHFSDELLPFAADLAASLQQSYMRIMSEILEQRDGGEGAGYDPDMDNDDEGEEKTLVAMNILKTLQQLVMGLEGNSATLLQLEEICIPVIDFTLRKEFVELFDEVFELLDSIQFALKAISNRQWALFDLIFELFKGTGVDFIAEMFPSLDNYITYGAERVRTDVGYRNKMLEIFQIIMTNLSLGCSDRVNGFKIADCLLLVSRGGSADDGLPLIIEHAMNIVQRGVSTDDPVITKALLMHSIETILNTLHYDANLGIRILNDRGWTGDFFNVWFANLGSFVRAHDKKLGVLAICAILASSAQNDNGVLQSAPQLILGALTLFEGFPAAVQRRTEAEDEYGDADSDDEADEEGDDDEDADGDDATETAEDDEDGDVTLDADVSDYLSSSGHRTSGSISSLPDGLSEAWSDEVLWETPFDALDVYGEFEKTVRGLEATAPQVLTIVTSQLSQAQNQVLHSVMQNAAEGGEVKIREAAKLATSSQADAANAQ